MKIGLIVFIIYLVFQAITVIVQHRAKREEERRKREAIERRRQAALGTAPPAHMTGLPAGGVARVPGMGGVGGGGAGGIHFTGAAPAPLPTPITLRTGTPMDDLAERRKAQLEQLRARRESRRVGLPVESVPPRQLPPDARPAPPGAAQRPARPPANIAADLAAAQARQRIEQARRVQQAAAREAGGGEPQAPKSKPRKPAPARAKEPHDSAAAGMSMAIAARTGEMTDANLLASRRRNALRAALGDRSSLRQLFILKELLDPPLSARERPGNPA